MRRLFQVFQLLKVGAQGVECGGELCDGSVQLAQLAGDVGAGRAESGKNKVALLAAGVDRFSKPAAGVCLKFVRTLAGGKLDVGDVGFDGVVLIDLLLQLSDPGEERRLFFLK